MNLLGICINGIHFFIRKSPFPQNKGADRRPSIHALYTRENVLSLNNPGNIPLGELIAEALNISPEEYHELQQMLDRAMTAWTDYEEDHWILGLVRCQRGDDPAP